MKKIVILLLMSVGFMTLFSACGNPEEDLNVMLNRAKGYAQSNEFSVAKECAKNALEMNRSDSRVYMLLALIERMQAKDPKELETAISHAQVAVSLAPESFEANHILAMLMLEKNPNNAKAIAYLEKAAKLEPKRFDNLIMLAEACLACRQPKRAYEVYRRMSFFPEYKNSAELHNQLGFTLVRMDQFQEAEKAFIKSVSLSSGHPQPQLNLARVYDYKLKDIPKALMAYEQYCVYAGGQVELLAQVKAVQERILALRKSNVTTRRGR